MKYSRDIIILFLITLISITLSGTLEASIDPIGTSFNTATYLGATNGSLLTSASFTSSTRDYYYRVALLNNQTYTFSITGPSGTDFDLYLYNSSRGEIKSATSGSYPEVLTYTVPNQPGSTGMLCWLRVHAYSGNGKYYLGWNLAPYTFATAYDLAGWADGPQIEGAFNSSQLNHYYKVDIAEGQRVQFILKGSSGTDFDFYFYDSYGTFIGMANSSSYPEVFTVTFTSSPNYIRVLNFSVNTGEYSITLKPVGALRVWLCPSGAISAGAQWSLDDGPWQNSGVTINDIAIGFHNLQFKPVSGWQAPGDGQINILPNQLNDFEADCYEQVCQCNITADVPDFGPLCVGQLATRTVTIHNNGNCPVNVTGITYNCSSVFSSGSCSGTIPAGGSINCSSTFAPTAAQTYACTMTIHTSCGDFSIAISGTGGGPIIRLGGNLAFGNVLVGQTATRTLTIYNDGNCTLNVSGITYPSGFSGSWSGAISAGGSHAVTVTFAPSAAQSYGGTITVNSASTSGTNTISCSGTGVITRIIRLGGDLAFGNVTVGQTATRTLTIYNDGNSTLNVSGITYPSGFSGSWNGAISAGGSQNVTVTFAPTAAQSYGGTITVNSDSTSGTNTISCSGTGMINCVYIIRLGGDLAFGNVPVGQTATRTLTIYNDGNCTLNVTGITYPPCFSGSWSGAISAGGSHAVTVTFAPSVAQSYSGTVSVSSNATSGTSTISCSGTGMYSLSSSVSGGHGSVSPMSGTYLQDTVVNLIATPDSGYRVKDWTGTDNDSSKSTTNKVTMTGNRTVTVEFELGNYVLTLTIEGSGTVDIDPESWNMSYPAGTEVQLTAVPSDGWVVRWEGDVADPDNNVTTVLMDQDQTVKAVFSEKQIVKPEQTTDDGGGKKGLCFINTAKTP